MARIKYIICSGLLLLMSAVVFSDSSININEDQLKKIMEGATQMQACFANIDQDRLEELGKQAQLMENKVRNLCENGNRAEAQSTAIKFGMEYMNSAEIQKIRECGEMAQAMMPEIPDYSQYADTEGNDGNEGRHVCDDI